MTKKKPLDECLIMSLKLGYFQEKCFSTDAIADFLDVDKEYVINEKDLNAVFPNVAEEDKERIIRIVAKKIRAGFDPINVTFLVSTKAKTNKDGTFSRKTCKLTIWTKETKE